MNRENYYFSGLIKESALYPYDNDNLNIDTNDFSNALEYFEASNSNITTHIIVERLAGKVDAVLSTNVGDRKFKQLVGNFIDRNNKKLHAPGPMELIAFTDRDKCDYLELFNIPYTISKKGGKSVINCEIVGYVDEITKQISSTTEFRLLKQNPIFWLLYCCIRFYTVHPNVQGVNSALAIYALAEYPSIFSKYFPHDVSRPGVMLYTIDQLSNKYYIKQQGHLFGALCYSINQSYKTHKPYFKEGADREIIRWIERIRNDQNSMLKKIADQYKKNFDKGNSITNQQDSYDDVPIADDVQNNSSVVESVSRRVTLKIITNGIDLQRVQLCAKLSQVSVSDLRLYITQIAASEYTEEIRAFIESVLFIFLYNDHHTEDEINTKSFLTWAAVLFRKTNSNDKNISKIKLLLDRWSEDSGVYDKYRREASRIAYKKSIFFYFIFSIQKYQNDR